MFAARRVGILVCVGTVTLVPSGRVCAQSSDQPTVGESQFALPGLVRVGSATPLGPGLVFSGLAGYGFRGAVVADSDAHHRAALDVAASVRLFDWLAVAGRFTGRYDRHVDTGEGVDTGWVGDPRLAVRASLPVSQAIFVAAQLAAWFPGADAPSIDPAATTVDAIAIATWAPPGGIVTLSTQGGFRLDQSAESVDEPELLSLSDRMALGVSESSAALLGAGVGLRLGATELFGEWSWDLLVGKRAPVRRESPMRASAGIRQRLGRAVVAQLTADVALSTSPEVGAMTYLFPVEPRFQSMAGLTVELGGRPDRFEDRLATAPDGPGATGADPTAPTGVDVAVKVSDEGGAPIAAAEVELSRDGDAPVVERTGDDGVATFTDVAPGPAQVTVRIADHRDGVQAIDVGTGRVASVSITLERALPPGQLRGVVRSFAGKRLTAELIIAPIGIHTRCDARGEFEVDLPPGEYEVSITAPGHKAQSRQVRIEEDGVTIVNVDLRK